MIILIDVTKPSDKIQYPFMIKTLKTMGIEVYFPNLIKDTKKSSQLILYKTEGFPPKIRQRCLLSSPLVNIVLEILASAFNQESEIKASGLCVCWGRGGTGGGVAESSWLASLSSFSSSS